MPRNCACSASWKKKLTPQQKAEYKAEKREEMQNLFKKIDDGVRALTDEEISAFHLSQFDNKSDHCF